jgi:hypothetical protein
VNALDVESATKAATPAKAARSRIPPNPVFVAPLLLTFVNDRTRMGKRFVRRNL